MVGTDRGVVLLTLMARATDTDVKAFFDRFNRMSEAEQDEVIQAGQLVQSPADLQDLPTDTVEFFESVADEQAE